MRPTAALMITTCLLLAACAQQPNAPASVTPTQTQTIDQPTTVAVNEPAKVQQPVPSVALDPQKGSAIGTTFEAFLSPFQEPAEEKDTPSQAPAQFRSTAPSLLRSERQSRGHGILRFSNDLSKAYLDLQVLGVKPEEIVLFHIHCGQPDQLGPIMVDFGLLGSLPEQFANGTFTAVITDDLIERTTTAGQGMSGMDALVGGFTLGCPVPPSLQGDLMAKFKTVAGMEYIARKGELYFNLHTKGQTFYGDIRGQIHQVATP